MKPLYKIFVLTGIIALLFASCEDEYGPRKESTPFIEMATVSPSSFTFGDSITLSARISDPATMLTSLAYELVSEGRSVVSGEIPLGGSDYVVEQSVYVPLLVDQADNSAVQIKLEARNVLNGSVRTEITELSASRPVYSHLYLVTDNGSVVTLEPLGNNQFAGNDLTLETSVSYKIAEQLNFDNTIDYRGDVYGNVNGKLAMIDQNGESAFVYTTDADYTKTFVFDNYAFTAATTGGQLGDDDLDLSAFANEDVNGEAFRTLTRTLEKGKTYTMFGQLGDAANIYNPDFFERTADSRVTFLGETGEYTIYYNPVRKNIFVGVDNPEYPQYLMACGYGLGYPTNVSTDEIGAVYAGHTRVHTSWGFGNVLNYVLLRQIGDGIYQGTFFTPGDHDHYAGFKPFENTGWGNEKRADQFTFTGEHIISGDNDWIIPNGENDSIIESANYRFTINLNDNTVNIEKVTL